MNRATAQERTRPIVVKIGGSTLGGHDTSIGDCAALHREGSAVVVVHGGGAVTSEWLERLGAPSEFIEGLRKTPAESLDIVVAVLAGLVNKRLVRDFAALGVQAIGVAGADAGLVRSPMNDRGLGLVGEAPTCDPEPLRALLGAGLLPVIAPIGLTPEGRELININADAVAGAIAVAAEAAALIVLSDVPGVLDGSGRPLEELDAEQSSVLRKAGTIEGGMLPKIAACQSAAAAGAMARIVDGRAAGALRSALAGEAGTLVR